MQYSLNIFYRTLERYVSHLSTASLIKSMHYHNLCLLSSFIYSKLVKEWKKSPLWKTLSDSHSFIYSTNFVAKSLQFCWSFHPSEGNNKGHSRTICELTLWNFSHCACFSHPFCHSQGSTWERSLKVTNLQTNLFIQALPDIHHRR